MAVGYPSVRLRPAISGEEARAATIAGLLGAIVLGILLEAVGAAIGVREFGAMAGFGYPGGWLVLLLVSLALSLLFVEFVSRTVDAFVEQVVALSSRQEYLAKVLVPLLRRSALTLTAANLGLAYGVVLAVGVYSFLVPAWLRLLGTPVGVPTIDVVGGIVWILYGGILGTVYGRLMER